MKRFRVGDRVRLIENDPEANGLVAGMEGTICRIDDVPELPIGVYFDNFTGGHDCEGRSKDRHGWFVDAHNLMYSKASTIKKFYEAVQGR